MPEPMAADVVVTVGARRFELTAGAVFTFGRSPDCSICLDPEDTGISRRAGLVAQEQSAWWLRNTSAKRALTVVDDRGLPSTLHPGRRVALDAATRVVVEGTRGSHCVAIEIRVGRADPPPVGSTAEPPDAGVSTAMGEEVLVNPSDRLALVALFAGYLLDPPHYDPHPRTYLAAANRLGWTRTQLLRRVEYLRLRLTNAGVPNLNGPTALYNLAEFALSQRLITKADLPLLPRPPHGAA